MVVCLLLVTLWLVQLAVAQQPSFSAHLKTEGETTVVFDASASNAGSGAVATYQWLFGDGYTGSGVRKEHTYARSGTYDVTLRIVHGDGQAGITTVAIDLSALTAEPTPSPEAPAPSANERPVTPRPVETPAPRLDVPVGSRVGMRAPGFTLPTLDDDLINLSNYLGTPVILEFWSSACNGCRTSMPHLESLRQRFAPLGLVVIALSVDPSPRNAQDFLSRGGYTEFVALREMNPSNKITMRTYGVSWIPHAFFIDRQGIIRYSGYVWELDAHLIEPWL